MLLACKAHSVFVVSQLDALMLTMPTLTRNSEKLLKTLDGRSEATIARGKSSSWQILPADGRSWQILPAPTSYVPASW